MDVYLAKNLSKLMQRIEREYLQLLAPSGMLALLAQCSVCVLAQRVERMPLAEELVRLVHDTLESASEQQPEKLREMVARFETAVAKHLRAERACILTLTRAPYLVSAHVLDATAPWDEMKAALMDAVPVTLQRDAERLRHRLEERDVQQLVDNLAEQQVRLAAKERATISDLQQREADGLDLLIHEQLLELVGDPLFIDQCEKLRRWFRGARRGHSVEVEWALRAPAMLLAAPEFGHRRIHKMLPNHVTLVRADLMQLVDGLPGGKRQKLADLVMHLSRLGLPLKERLRSLEGALAEVQLLAPDADAIAYLAAKKLPAATDAERRLALLVAENVLHLTPIYKSDANMTEVFDRFVNRLNERIDQLNVTLQKLRVRIDNIERIARQLVALADAAHVLAASKEDTLSHSSLVLRKRSTYDDANGRTSVMSSRRSALGSRKISSGAKFALPSTYMSAGRVGAEAGNEVSIGSIYSGRQLNEQLPANPAFRQGGKVSNMGLATPLAGPKFSFASLRAAAKMSAVGGGLFNPRAGAKLSYGGLIAPRGGSRASYSYAGVYGAASARGRKISEGLMGGRKTSTSSSPVAFGDGSFNNNASRISVRESLLNLKFSAMNPQESKRSQLAREEFTKAFEMLLSMLERVRGDCDRVERTLLGTCEAISNQVAAFRAAFLGGREWERARRGVLLGASRAARLFLVDALQLLGEWMTVMVPALYEEMIDELILDEVELEAKVMVEEAVDDTLAEAHVTRDGGRDDDGDGSGERVVPQARARVEDTLVDEPWRDAIGGRLNPFHSQRNAAMPLRHAPPATAAAGRRAEPPTQVQKSSSCALL